MVRILSNMKAGCPDAKKILVFSEESRGQGDALPTAASHVCFQSSLVFIELWKLETVARLSVPRPVACFFGWIA
jgi:hypothetical protein